jgi:hypothetical protein
MKKINLIFAALALMSISAFSIGQTQNNKSSGAGAKGNKPAKETPEILKFAIECSQNTNTRHKQYFVLSSKKAYMSDGKETVYYPKLEITDDEKYVFTYSQSMSGFIFDSEIQINRQNLNMIIFTDMRGDEKKSSSSTTRYTCTKAEAEPVMAMIKEIADKKSNQEEEKKKELKDNQKL